MIDTNKLAAWLDDNTILKADAVSYVGKSMKKNTDTDEVFKARREKLYSNYEQWCDEGAVHQVALQRFTANILDVCQQLKIDVTERNRDSRGRSIRGLTIRQNYHDKYMTPVTKKLFSDEETLISAEAVTKQTLDSVDDAEDVEVFLSVTNTPVLNEPEYF